MNLDPEESMMQAQSFDRIELLVNNVYDVAGLRRSLREMTLVTDFCTTVTAFLHPDEVLMAAAKKFYGYFRFKFFVFSRGAAFDDSAIAFHSGPEQYSSDQIAKLQYLLSERYAERIDDHRFLGLEPVDPAEGTYSVYSREIPYQMGFVTIVTEENILDNHSELLLLKLLESFAVALQNASEYGKVKEQSMRDSLTGLFNRRVLEEMLDLEDRKREVSPLSVLIIDLDDFKKINDTLGHQAGDVVLQKVGALLVDKARGSDLVVRNGGEEFAILLPSASAAIALEVGERFRKALQETRIDYGGREIRITASIGIAHRSGRESFPARDLVLQADHALYSAKKSGKNKVCFYSSSPVLVGKSVRIPSKADRRKQETATL